MKATRQSSNFVRVTPLISGFLALGLLTALFIFISSPGKSVSSVPLPVGVSLNTNYSELVAPTPTKQPPLALNIPTNSPLATQTPVPTKTQVETPVAEATVAPTPGPTPEPDPKPAGISPARLRIPSIGVDAQVEKVGQTKEGAMDIPTNIWNVGWYEPGYRPGMEGSAVIAGHLDGVNSKAIFWDLGKLKPGQKVFITGEDGKELTFEVFEVAVYPYDKAPLDKIFLDTGGKFLNLITCNGIYDTKSQIYNNRLVVYTRQIEEGQ